MRAPLDIAAGDTSECVTLVRKHKAAAQNSEVEPTRCRKSPERCDSARRIDPASAGPLALLRRACDAVAMLPTRGPLHGGHDETLNELQRRTLVAIAAALGDRLAIMGEDASGLYSYYARKLRHDALLGECDLRVLEMLRQRVGQFRRVWEIGPGVGQLTAMLALDGHEVVVMDRDPRRYAAMAKVLDVLERHDPAARGRIATHFGAFPAVLDEKEDVHADAVLVLGCTFTAAETEYRAFEDVLSRFAFGLIDFPRLFTETANRGEWRQRARDFAERCRAAVVPVADYEIPEEDKRGELFLVSGQLSSLAP